MRSGSALPTGSPRRAWPRSSSSAGAGGPLCHVSKQLWRAPAVGRLIRSVAYRLADRLRGTGREYRPVSIAGLPVRADASHWAVTDLYFANAEYEPQTFRYLADHLPEGGVFVDIGANAGILTLVAAARVGPGAASSRSSPTRRSSTS